MTEPTKGVTFETVEKVAIEMLTQGVKPSVRGIISVTGGKTTIVSNHLRAFFDKRDQEIAQMADELKSGKLAKVLADEMTAVVNCKTAALSEIIERQRQQIEENISLMQELCTDCDQQIIDAENRSKQAIEQAKKESEKAKAELRIAVEQKNQALANIATAEQKATALVDDARERVSKLEREAESLREQVKLLSVDQAKREIEQAQLHQAQNDLRTAQNTIADFRAEIAGIKAEKAAIEQYCERLNSDLKDAKAEVKQGSQAQTQLIESQRNLSSTQNQLAQSEREREALSHALFLARSNKSTEKNTLDKGKKQTHKRSTQNISKGLCIEKLTTMSD